MSRRFLALGVLVGSWSFAGVRAAADPSTSAPLAEPSQLASHDGQLSVELTAAPGPFTIGSERFDGKLYNGQYVPAVWRIKPGDTLSVALHNDLAEPTNLHFHGLHVPPRGNGDNVFVHVAPGESFSYRVAVPADHDPGLYWFHTHAHGLVSEQIIGGLSGAIIVDGLEQRFPILRGMKEHVMLMKHVPHPRADWEELVTLNGQVAPTIDVRPGEAQFWRIGNIGADLFLNLKLDGAAMYLIATDGHALLRPKRIDGGLLGPGQRIEVVVIGPPAGRHSFRSVPLVMEEGRPPLPEHLLGVLASSGPGVDPAAVEARVSAASAPPTPAFLALSRSPIGTRRTFVFTRSMDRAHFYINGKLFGDAGTEIDVPLGSVEEWTIVNQDNQLHNFHIHQTAFFVTEINGVAQPMESLYDTITVPSLAGGRPGSVKVKIPFTDPIIAGRFVFHCHVTKHEDKGMMQTIDVEPPNHAP